jgi:hypothetical protein
MKYIRSVFTLLFLLLSCNLSANAIGTWFQLPGPLGLAAPVVRLQTTATSLYLLSANLTVNKLDYSLDEGKTWHIWHGLSSVAIKDFVLNSQGALGYILGTNNQQQTIFSQLDNGQWKQTIIPAEFNVTKILMASAHAIFLQTDNSQGIVFSNDDGQHWEMILPQQSINSVAQFQGRYYAASNSGIWFSIAPQTNWQTCSTNLGSSVPIVVANTTQLFVVNQQDAYTLNFDCNQATSFGMPFS